MSLEVRGDYINIYYRGGNLLKIEQQKKGYKFYFDEKYCLNKNDDSAYEKLKALNSHSAEEYASSFELMMREMDSWFAAHPKKEREYQHNLLIHNSCIIDIEYQIKNTMRLDMIMVVEDRMIIVENKYGENAISGGAGLSKHYNDICAILNDDVLHEELLASIKNIASVKYRLGLIEKSIDDLKKEKTEILFLIAAYNPNSMTINNEVCKMNISIPAQILFTKDTDYEINLEKAKDLFEYGN